MRWCRFNGLTSTGDVFSIWNCLSNSFDSIDERMNDSGCLMFGVVTVLDCHSLVTLINSSYRGRPAEQEWTNENGLIEGKWTNARVINEIIDSDNSTLMIFTDENDKHLQGCVSLQHWVQFRTAYVGMLTVRPDLQDKGLGTTILSLAEKYVREHWQVNVITMIVIVQRTVFMSFDHRRADRQTDVRQAVPSEKFRTVKRNDLQLTIMSKSLWKWLNNVFDEDLFEDNSFAEHLPLTKHFLCFFFSQLLITLKLSEWRSSSISTEVKIQRIGNGRERKLERLECSYSCLLDECSIHVIDVNGLLQSLLDSNRKVQSSETSKIDEEKFRLIDTQDEASSHRIVQETARTVVFPTSSVRISPETVGKIPENGSSIPTGILRIFPANSYQFPMCSARNQSETIGNDHEKFRSEYCFHKISGRIRKWTIPGRFSWPGYWSSSPSNLIFSVISDDLQVSTVLFLSPTSIFDSNRVFFA